jgi:hypothetical protein
VALLNSLVSSGARVPFIACAEDAYLGLWPLPSPAVGSSARLQSRRCMNVYAAHLQGGPHCPFA